MSNDLIINVAPEEVSIALLRSRELTELTKEKSDYAFNVGDYYLAKVSRIQPNLNAAFVDLGYEKDAFLHYLDLGPEIQSLNKFVKETSSGRLKTASLRYFKFVPPIRKEGKIGDVLKAGQTILVKVIKEPISQKGPRLSCELSLPGRYMVLVPFADKISVSTKIRENQERDRLKNLMQALQPENFGIIIRTAAENQSAEDLEKDLKDLMARWDEAFEKIKPGKTPTKVLGELSRATTLLRDLENKNFTFDSIVVNDESYVNQIREYMRTNFPDREKAVRFFKGRLPIFEHYGINRQIRTLFGRNVPMKSGAYLIIEHTEALHVIDVNSGNAVRSGTTQEDSALAVNLEAADEIARQLRLRDMGGIIVVDFIDLYKAENRKILFQRMRDAMKDDKAKHNILPPSKIGLIQITRERVRPQINIETAEACPSCQGSGKVTASVNLTDEIANAFARKVEKHPEASFVLLVHPYVEAYLTKGLFSSVWKKWKKTFGRRHRLEPRTTLGMLEYRFLDAQGLELEDA